MFEPRVAQVQGYADSIPYEMILKIILNDNTALPSDAGTNNGSAGFYTSPRGSHTGHRVVACKLARLTPINYSWGGCIVTSVIAMISQD